jgi:uncharacterized protein (DUF433 family)
MGSLNAQELDRQLSAEKEVTDLCARLAGMKLPPRIDARPEIMMGKPCIKGTRIPVYLVLQKIAGGESVGQILSAYPQLKSEDIQACLEYAALLAAEEVVLAEA